MSEETFYCQRRAEGGPGARPETGPDHWRENKDPYRQPRSCSYCGSLPPDDFMAAIKAGAEVGPTDKSYKVYIELPARDPEALHVYTATDRPFDRSTLKAWDELTEAEQEAVRAGGWHPEKIEDGYYGLSKVGATVTGKFYFQHLSQEQRQEFIDLVNARSIVFGYPGYLYTTPYFAHVIEPV